MRNFNEEEKYILTRIVNAQKKPISQKVFGTINLSDLFDEVAKKAKVKIIIKRNEKIVTCICDNLPITNPNAEDPFDKIYTVFYKATTILSLFDYLEKNHLIYLFQMYTKNDNPIILNNYFDFKSNTMELVLFKNNDYEVIFKKLDYSIISSPELIEYVENNFRDEEQIRHEDNVKLQKRSINLATALGIVSIIVAIISLVPESRKQQIFGITKKDEPVKRLKENNPDTVITKQKQIISKKSSTNDTLRSKSISNDSLKSK